MICSPNDASKKNILSKARKIFKKEATVKKQQEQHKQELIAEKHQRLKEATEKRLKKSNLLSMKTRKGQPVMKHQISHLLEKIKQQQT